MILAVGPEYLASSRVHAITPRDGGQVGLAARDGAEDARMRDMLVLLLSPPEGQA